MHTFCTVGILAIATLFPVKAEVVYLEDLNRDLDRRNFQFGVPSTLQFRLRHSQGETNLNLAENLHLNAHAPMYTAGKNSWGQPIARKLNISPDHRTKYYQDRSNGAYVVASCQPEPHGPCTRTLTGNLVINGHEHKLEPDLAAISRRQFGDPSGAPHSLERIDHAPVNLAKGEGGVMTAAIDYDLDMVPHPAIETSSMPTTTDVNSRSLDSDDDDDVDDADDDDDIDDDDDDDDDASDDDDDVSDDDDDDVDDDKREERKLLQILLNKLESLKRTKRMQPMPQIHAVELLLVIDHMIYDKFAALYTGEETILLKMREYFNHITNGVDIRYASIRPDDIRFYITISGYYVSTNVADSPWLNYTQNPTDGSAGLSFMKDWRLNTPNLPDNDHAMFITGSDIQSSGYPSVVGIAYLEGVCNYYGVSINEDLSFFKSSGVFAHELGHNLGSYHDSGPVGSGCHMDDDYVMAPYVAYVGTGTTHTEPWRFSECSIDEFRTYAVGMGSGSCTLNTGTYYNDTEFADITSTLAGQFFTLDEQCQLLRGAGSGYCGNVAGTPGICRDLYCSNVGGGCQRSVAAPGTPCGGGKVCFRGLCVWPSSTRCSGGDCNDANGPNSTRTTTEAPTTTVAPHEWTCVDTPTVAGMTCPELQTLMGTKVKRCKKFARECCNTCVTTNACRKNRPVRANQRYTCDELFILLGPTVTCDLFTYECCKLCQTVVSTT